MSDNFKLVSSLGIGYNYIISRNTEDYATPSYQYDRTKTIKRIISN